MLGGGAWFGGWLLEDVELKLTVGLAVGFAAGRVLGWLMFRSPPKARLAHTGEGIAALGATLVVYGVTELARGYGFLAVFVAAVVLRDQERAQEYHEILHGATETIERLGSARLLLLVGGAIAEGGLAALGWREVSVALALVLVIRPVTGWVSPTRTGLHRVQRLVTAGFGIREMGSIYYLAHAGVHEGFPGIRRLWAVVLLTIELSVLVHRATPTGR